MKYLLPLLALCAAPAAAAEVACSITAGDQTIEGPCAFAAKKDGSFTAALKGGTSVGGANQVMLDLSGARPHLSASGADGAKLDWGDARRDPVDKACWVSLSARVCAREVAAVAGTTAGGPAPTASAGDRPLNVDFTGRCHMDACTWYRQSQPWQVGEGSAAVPGRVMAVMQTTAQTGHPTGDYPDSAPADAKWRPPVEARYFCSMKRPAFQSEVGSWTVLPLPQVFGATETITAAYLHVCHPDVAGGDPYDLPGTLGYTAGGDVMGVTYPDLDALLR
ncbi:hypothetical protein [Paracoccus suum]|nr:hypothetical protein [Paracoccus suum]